MMITSNPPTGDEDELDTLLVRYWTHEATAGERERIDAWFARHPGERVRHDRLYRGIRAGEWSPLTTSSTAERVVRILRGAGIVSRNNTRSPSPSHRTARTASYATVGLIVAVLVWCVASQPWPSPRHAQPVSQGSIYTTGNGERSTVTLPDGSTVILNVGSQLVVPFDYGHGHRRLAIIGEALFRVSHANGTPFTVTAGQTTTRVLGTTFVVRRYQTDSTTSVAVRDGKVAVGDVVLTASQEAVVNGDRTPRVQSASAGRFGFVDGRLVVHDQPLPDVVMELNRWYDADVRLGDSRLLTRRITGTFEIGSITDLMWILQTTFNVAVIREGRMLTLYPRG